MTRPMLFNPQGGPAPGGHYSHAAVGAGLVFIAGQLPVAPDGRRLFVTLPELDELSEIDVSMQPGTHTLWAFIRGKAESHFSPLLLREITELRRLVTRHLLACPEDQRARFWVLGSRIPGVFNLGGDLTYFAELIRLGNRDKLRQYAHACIEAIHLNLAQDPPVVSIALVSHPFTYAQY